MTDIVDKLRESYSHLNRDEAITSNSVDTIQKAVSEIKRLRFERDQLKTAAGIDEWCRQFERANITLNEKLFALHERLEKQAVRLVRVEAERDRLRDALSGLLGVVDWANASLASGEDEQWIHGQLMRAAGHARTALKENEHD